MLGLPNFRPCFLEGTATSRRQRTAILLLLSCTAAAAHATTADDLCASTADPCVVTGFVNVDDASIIDLGPRTLRIVGRLDVRTGSMSLNAGRIEVPLGGELRARGDTALPAGEITATAGFIQIDGRIDASGSPGGSVDLTSDGELSVGGSIEASSLTNDELGGAVCLVGGVVNLSGPVTAQGGRERLGGDIEIRASGAMSVAAVVNASGGGGGTIDLTAGADAGGGQLLIAGTGEVLADATGGGDDGGSIDLSTGTAGSIEVRGRLSAVGRGASDGGGDGGIFEVDSVGDLVLSSGASMTANGGTPDGTAGGIDLSSGSDMQIAGRIELRGVGAEAEGGELLADAGGAAEVTGIIDVRGGNTGGGIDFAAGGELIVAAGARVDASASGGGSGGSISLASEARLAVGGELTADGGSVAGSSGGQVDLDGCSVEIQASAVLSSQRSGGSNVLIGRDDTVIAGTLRADPALGRNQLRYPGPDQEPIIFGSAMIVPAALLSAEAAILPCQPRTPSPTRTPTPSPTPGGNTPTQSATRTGTRSPAARLCLGDCDADQLVSIDELIRAVVAALAQPPVSGCGGIDRDGNSAIDIDELVAAVAAAVLGCG